MESAGTRVGRRGGHHAPQLGSLRQLHLVSLLLKCLVPGARMEGRGGDQAGADGWKNRTRETGRGRRSLEGQTRWGCGPRARPCGRRTSSKGGEVHRTKTHGPGSGVAGGLCCAAHGPLEGSMARAVGPAGPPPPRADLVLHRGRPPCRAWWPPPSTSPCATCVQGHVGASGCAWGGAVGARVLGLSCLLGGWFARCARMRAMGPPAWPSRGPRWRWAARV